MHRNAFTLVELSIVLVILGLLVGGVLAGQSLIRAAELRSVTSQYSGFKTAMNAFKEKYLGLPGDITNGTAFWGKNNAACPGDTGSAATDGTCNGDGDGIIEFGTASGSITGEAFQAWKQLASAGLVEGTYTGISGPNCCLFSMSSDHIFGTNSPTSKVGSAGWGIAHLDNSALVTNWVSQRDHRANFTLGGDDGNYADDPVLSTQDAWGIDTKIDDGKPMRGVMETNVIGCTDATAENDFDADYVLATAGASCALLFKH